jgi:hypothetical protein
MGVNIYTKKTSEQMEKERIIEMHRRAVNVEFKKFNIISEQGEDWKEKSYVKPLTDAGYTQVQEINLPDGTYKKYGSGYQVEISDGSDVDTGYVIVTNNGIRGMWGGDDLQITGKKTDEDTYKIFYKNVGYKPKEVSTPTVAYTINEESLSSASIPSQVIQASAPIVKPIGGKGVFYLGAQNDPKSTYGYDFSKTLPNISGKYYLLTENAEFLNSKFPDFKAKPKTQWVGFVDQTMTGNIIYTTNEGEIVVKQGTIK